MPTRAPPAVVVPREGALDKGSLPLGEDVVDEIMEASEVHLYSFEGSAGDTVSIKLVTGGKGLSGSGFYAPLATIFGPDGQIVLAYDQSRRSHSGELTFATTGTYQITIGADDRGRGVEVYTITIAAADA